MHGRLRYALLAFAATVVVLGWATPAFANVIAPSVGFLPGMAPLALGMALPLSVAAAFLERPFFGAAGVRKHTLWYSLQANLVSLAVGYVFFTVGLFFLYLFHFPFLLLAPALSIAAEGWYFKKRKLTEGEPLRWRWMVLGNLFSSAVMFVVPVSVELLDDRYPTLRWDLLPFQESLFWCTTVLSLLIFAVSFFMPGMQDRRATRRCLVTATPAATPAEWPSQ